MLQQRPHTAIGRRLVALACVLALFLPAAATAAAGSSVPLGADSPEALVKRLNAAAEKNDFAEIAACLAPPDRAAMSMMMVLAATMMTAFMGMGSEMATGMAEAFQDEASMTAEQKAQAAAEKKKMEEQAAAQQKKLEAVLDKYGVTELMEQDHGDIGDDPAKNAEKLLAGVDQVGLITDLMAFLEESGMKDTEGGDAKPPLSVPMGDLTDLKVEGDTATGTINGEPAHFVKVDGRWYVKMPEEGAKGGTGE
jgi:hypothetical protein